jgi:hypothetical protein
VPERELRLTVSCPVQEKEDRSFSMTKSEKKDIDVAFVPPDTFWRAQLRR